jgi:hypothetical protein
MGSSDASSAPDDFTLAPHDVTQEQIAEAFTLLDGVLMIDVDDADGQAWFLDRFRPQRDPLTVEWLAQMAASSAPSDTSEPLPPLPAGERLVVDFPSTEQQNTLFGLSLLGATRTDMAQRALRPYLHSHQLHERWLSALWLGYLYDEQALPVLSEMTTAVLPTQDVWAPEGRGGAQYCFTEWRNRVPELLQYWGSGDCIRILRAALITVVTHEQVQLVRPVGPELTYRWHAKVFSGDAALHRYYGDLLQWVTYEHRLVYSLGYLGAFGALFGVETPVGVYSADGDYLEQEVRTAPVWKDITTTAASFGDALAREIPTIPPKPRAAHQHPARFRGNVWRVHACCGFLEPSYNVRQKRVYAFTEAPQLAGAVANLLKAQFGRDTTAQHEAMQDYEAAAFLYYVTLNYERTSHHAHR